MTIVDKLKRIADRLNISVDLLKVHRAQILALRLQAKGKNMDQLLQSLTDFQTVAQAYSDSKAAVDALRAQWDAAVAAEDAAKATYKTKLEEVKAAIEAIEAAL